MVREEQHRTVVWGNISNKKCEKNDDRCRPLASILFGVLSNEKPESFVWLCFLRL